MPRRTTPYLLRASLRPDVEPDVEGYPFGIPVVRDLGRVEITSKGSVTARRFVIVHKPEPKRSSMGSTSSAPATTTSAPRTSRSAASN